MEMERIGSVSAVTSAILIYIIMGIKGTHINDHPCYNGSLFPPIWFQDNTTLDEPIFEYNAILDGSLKMSKCTDVLKINGTSLYLTKDITRDCNILPSGTFCELTCRFNFTDHQNNTNTLEANQAIRLERENLPTGEMFFSDSIYSKKVKENTRPGIIFTSTGYIKQTDCFQVGKGKLLLEGPDATTFELSTDGSNTIRLNKELDYDKGKTFYNITLVFEQTQNNMRRENRSLLIVNVEDVDDMDPAFNDTKFKLNITENHNYTNWTVTVPEISAYDRDKGQGRQNLTFWFYVNETHKVSLMDDFMLDSFTGKIKITNSLDRETKPQYRYTIKVEQENDYQRSATASLTINVLDENDNVPEFTDSFLQASIDEQSSHGTYITLVTAIDKDSPPYNYVTFMLSNYTDVLYIENANNISGIIRVGNAAKLDREELGDSIQLEVIAIDATDGRTGGNVTLNITLHDINDNSPVFDQLNGYTFYGSGVGVVGQVLATDKDSIENGNGIVRYFDLHNVNYISVGEISGEINLTTPIGDELTFTIQACDNPIQQYSKRCTQVPVHITVNMTNTTDINKEVFVYENVKNGSVIVVIDTPGRFYESVSTDVPFEVNRHTGVVSTTGNIDRENGTTEYTMHIHVISLLNVILANITLTIHVLDVNDNTPIFSQNEYFFPMPDVFTQGLSIGFVNATDIDIGNNSLVLYILPDAITSSFFVINETTGEIKSSSNTPGDRNMIQIQVIARDLGYPSLQSSCSVYISKTKVQNKLVVIEAPISVSVLEERKTSLQESLTDILHPLVIKIEKTEPKPGRAKTASQTGSYMHISATNSNGSVIHEDTLQRDVLRHYNKIEALFDRQTIVQEHAGEEFGASQIALIILASVILVGGIIAIFIIYKSRKGNGSDKGSLMTVDDENNPVIEPQVQSDQRSLQSIEITVDLGDEIENTEQTSDYDGSQNINDQTISEYSANASQADIQQVVNDEEQTTEKEAEIQIDKLDDVLNEEEDKCAHGAKENDPSLIGSLNQGNVDTEHNTLYPPRADYEPSVIDPVSDTTITEGLNVEDEIKVPSPCGPFDNPVNEEFQDNQSFDEESGELITSNEVVSTSKFANVIVDKPIKRYENIVDVIEDQDDLENDQEPDVDYNDKQVRFSTIVLDSEENKFKPLDERENKPKLERKPAVDIDEEEIGENKNDDNELEGAERQSEESEQRSEKPSELETPLQGDDQPSDNIEEEMTAF